jgi:hypothetical protein
MVTLGLLALLLVQDATTHSTHNARHGGMFFPAFGDTLHVEGVWDRQGLLKVFLTDEAGRPLSVDRLQAVHGRVVIGRSESPLVLRAHDLMFEGRIPRMTAPVELLVELRLPGHPEPEGLYFIFPRLTDTRALSFASEPTVIPRTLAGILDALNRDAGEGERLIAAGQSAYVFGPALKARDHVLALERFVAPLDADRRARAESAMRKTVRAAWLLHTAGDDGTPEQARAATVDLRAAVDDVIAVLGAAR